MAATANEREQHGPRNASTSRTSGHAVSPLSTPRNGGGPYSSSHEIFRRLAQRTAHGVGHPWAFALSVGVVLAWGISGPVFHFSDTWQLVINTGTTIVTFLMVFLIQNTQNRDSHAIHLKLDELIRANARARNILLCAEELTDNELNELQDEFAKLAKEKISRREERGPQSGDSVSSSRNGARSSRTNPSSN